AVSLVALFVALGRTGDPTLVRFLAPAGLLARTAAGEPGGLPLALSLLLGGSSVAMGALLHWRWLEARPLGSSAASRCGAVFRWALGTRWLRGRSPGSRGLIAQSLVYLARSGRYRFFGAYALCGAFFLAAKLPVSWSPESRALVVLVWGAAGSGA